MNSRRTNLALVLAIVVLLVGGYLIAARPSAQAKFAGADDAGMAAIQEIHPGYQQWFTPLFEPPGDEVATGLFALQAGLGGGLLGFCLGALRSRRKVEKLQARCAELAAAADAASAAAPPPP